MTEVVYVSTGRIEIERYYDGSVNVTTARDHYRSTILPLSNVEAAEFLAAVAREFDVTFTANPKPPKVGDVVDRETAFALPNGSLVEVAETGAPYFLRSDGLAASRFHSTLYNRHAFDHTEKFKIVYVYTEGGNA